MGSTLSNSDLTQWGSIPADRLSSNPDAKLPVRVFESADDLYRATADQMIEDVLSARARGENLRWILPVGPTGQFPYFVKRVNRENISLDHVYIFHMDEMLDWTGALIDYQHPFNFRRYMTEQFYEKITEELRPPESQRRRAIITFTTDFAAG